MSDKPIVRVLWHEPSNMLAAYEIRQSSGLPLLMVLDDEFTGSNPFYTYPQSFLDGFGWHVLGEL